MFDNILNTARSKKTKINNLMNFEFPNILKPFVQQTENSKEWLKELKKNGVITIYSEELANIAKQISEKYFNPINIFGVSEAEEKIKSINNELFIFNATPKERRQEYYSGGTKISHYISFKDSICEKIFLNDDINSMLYNYYNRQPYYRNHPLIQEVNTEKVINKLDNGNWHVDHFRQISFMLLINDISINDIHMDYYLGSHRKRNKEGLCSFEIVNEVNNNPQNIYSLVGKKGTLFIFDASGIHRGNYQENSIRKMLHINVTTGHNILNYNLDDTSNWEALKNKPSYIQKMFSLICRSSHS